MSGEIAAWVEELARFPLRPLEDDSTLIAQRRQAALRAFEWSLPPLYRLASVDRRLLPERVRAASMANDRPRNCAAFFGPSGRGKTRLAVTFLRVAMVDYVQHARLDTDDLIDLVPKRFRFVDARELAVSRLRSSADGLAAIQLAIHADLLLLDDLGSECSIPSNPLADVIAARHAAQLPTWVTTELAPEQVALRYGGGAARRIFEGATLHPF